MSTRTGTAPAHTHLWINVRDEDGETLYLDCVERGCSRRMSPREFADQEAPTPRRFGNL